jgi:DNA-binding NtrC family response regulator
LTDIRMPGIGGFDVLKKTLSLPDPPPCILFTAYGSIDTPVEAMKLGAFDFVTKPVDIDQLELRIKRALETRNIKSENAELKRKLDESRRVVPNILGESPAIRQVMDTVRQVAPTRSSVLIQGESGTGKELVARALHELSGRKGDFVAIHCAAIPETLFESELFGHEKGAFTGAVEQHKGFFEKADGGTIFLDEIGEVPLPVQVKLLRVLETRSFERVGGTQNIAVDVRIVSATNRDLEQMVASGAFREDLYYRLNVVKILIPPLRERTSDIPILVRGFLSQLAAENGKENMTISEPAMAALCAARWPGNIRELRNCVENMVVLCRTGEIGLENVPVNIRESSSPGITRDILAAPSCDLEKNERILIERALNECGGNRSRAAEKLGISRRTLHRKLKLYNIE